MTQLHSTDVDGVRTYWVETGRPTLAATLMFRQGMADEHFTTSGWTHLLEHMCLHGKEAGALAVNGSVSLLATSFTAHGPADGVVDHLREVCDWLADPDLRSLEHERKVLAAEAGVRGGADLRQALTWRYGARGPGLAGQPEPGIARATPDGLRDLAARVLTRGNAVLMLDGPPPEGLRLPLRDGALQPLRAAVECEDPRPASYQIHQGLVLSGSVRRSASATFLARWLEQELRSRLREEAGAAYAPWSHYEPVDHDHAVVLGGSDVATEHHEALTENVLQLVNRLRRGPDAEAVERLVAEFVQGVSDPYQAYGVAVRAGHYHLRGDAPQSLEETLDEARAVTFESVADVAHQLADSLLVGLPPGAPEDARRLPRVTQQLPEQAGGATRYRSANAPADKSLLVVEPRMIRVVDGDRAVGVALDRVVGLLSVPDGARQVVDQDGWSVTVEPTMWRRGRRAVGQIDALVPTDLHLPQPDRSAEDVPKPASLVQRYRHVLAGASLTAVGMVLLVAVIASDLEWLAPGIAVGAYAFSSSYRKKAR